MNEQELSALGPALGRYLDRYLFCCEYTQTFGHMGTYTRGLLSDLKRKTAQGIALKGGTPVRTMQEFLRDHVWHEDKVKQLQQQHTATLLRQTDDPTDLGTIGIIDETSDTKKGDKTPACSVSTLVAWAKSTTASSPSTLASVAVCTRA